jgi:hypothetical protein
MTEKKNHVSRATKDVATGVKLPWKAPTMVTMEARDGEASFTYGGTDTGIYHS